MLLSTEKIDTLTTCDLGVKTYRRIDSIRTWDGLSDTAFPLTIFLCDLSENDQTFRCDLPCGDTRDDTEGTIPLNVGQVLVVGVLQLVVLGLQDVFVEEGGQDRTDSGLADLASEGSGVGTTVLHDRLEVLVLLDSADTP